MTETLKPFQTVRDILAQVARLHRDSSARFAAAACACSDYRMRALLAFLEERESEQLTALHRLQSSGDEALESFVQSVPSAALEEAADASGVVAGFELVIDAYRRRDEALLRFCRQLAGTATLRARVLFADLAAMHQRNQARLREALLDC